MHPYLFFRHFRSLFSTTTDYIMHTIAIISFGFRLLLLLKYIIVTLSLDQKAPLPLFALSVHPHPHWIWFRTLHYALLSTQTHTHTLSLSLSFSFCRTIASWGTLLHFFVIVIIVIIVSSSFVMVELERHTATTSKDKTLPHPLRIVQRPKNTSSPKWISVEREILELKIH